MRVRGVQSGGKSGGSRRCGPTYRRKPCRDRTLCVAAWHGSGHAGKISRARRLDARIDLLPSAPKLKQRDQVHFHLGSSETIAKIHFCTGMTCSPGQSAFVQLRLQDEMLVLPGDRFIVRHFSPVTTIGGGEVLDALARRPLHSRHSACAFLEILEQGNRPESLAAMVERAPLGLATGRHYPRAAAGWRAKSARRSARSDLPAR